MCVNSEDESMTKFHEGWCAALNSVISCLGEDYPNAGGDIRVMLAVDALLQRQKELYFNEFISCRGVQTPCKRCGGFGVYTYGSTSTWHGGVGGQAMTNDVCNKCWGSGDENNHWPDRRLWRKGLVE
jgi:hypothetical protein